MNIFIYSDESGVFDKVHNQYFVFGGLIFLSKNDRDNMARKYIHAEKVIREKEFESINQEVKAATVSNSSKNKLYRSLNQVEKFGIIIHQQKLYNPIFDDKKTKQRYLDWAYKIAVKRKFETLISLQKIDPENVEGLYFFVDEHTTATNGRYELREALEQEFKIGTFNLEWSKFYPPLFKNLKHLKLNYCNSQTVTLVRAADIVANKLYYLTLQNKLDKLNSNNFSITYHP